MNMHTAFQQKSISLDEILPWWIELRKKGGQSWLDVIADIVDMSNGGRGRFLYAAHMGDRRVRNLYFRGWSDEDFKEALTLLENTV